MLKTGRRLPMLLMFGIFLISLAAATIADTPGLVVNDRLIGYVQAKFGEKPAARLRQWRDMVTAHRDKTQMEKLAVVNRFFTGIPSVLDSVHWGAQNYWATPFELMVTNGGDCEDFAIAKYFSLRALQVPDAQLRITYVTAYQRGPDSLTVIPHMVLAYYPQSDGEPLILDNLVPDILPVSRRPDLLPRYSFNGEGLWRAKRRGQGKLIGRAESNHPWQDLIERMQQDGF